MNNNYKHSTKNIYNKIMKLNSMDEYCTNNY